MRPLSAMGSRSTAAPVAAISLIIVTGTVQAEADRDFGRHLAGECMTCHRSATATSTIPNIFGLGEIHFIEVIKAYRAKALPNPVMQNIASRLSDEEITSLARYFSTTRKP